MILRHRGHPGRPDGSTDSPKGRWKKRRAIAAPLLLIAFGMPLVARAQRSKAKPAAPAKSASSASASAPAPAPPRVSSIGYIATTIAQALGQVEPGAVIAISPLVTDTPAPKADDLAIRVATQIAGRMGVGRVHPQPVALAVARGVSGRAASLVYVQLEIAKGELRATADLYPVISNGWERLRNPVPGPRAHGFAGSPLDAEIRTFLQPITLERAAVHKAKHEESDVIAIGCGDVDADGGLEIVLSTRTRLVVGKLQAGKLAVMKTAPWTQLASRAPVPLREPLGTVVVSPRPHPGEILLGNTDRSAIAVDATLVTRRQLTGLPLPGADGEACAGPAPEYGALDGPAVDCTPPPKGDPAVVLEPPVPRFDAVAAVDVVGPTGAVSQVIAAREPGGKLRLRRTDASGKVQETPIEGVGAQIALGDLDLDGVPEIAFSGEGVETDALVVWSWRPTGLVQRLRYPTKEPIRAIAACPPEERGVPGLVAVVGSEVWLVR